MLFGVCLHFPQNHPRPFAGDSSTLMAFEGPCELARTVFVVRATLEFVLVCSVYLVMF